MLTVICHLLVDAVLAVPLSFCPCSTAAELYLSLYSSNTDGGVIRATGSPCCVFHEDALALQLHEKFSTCRDEEGQ